MVEPNRFTLNDETATTNSFQHLPDDIGPEEVAARALKQHRALQELLLSNGVTVTVARSADDTPDAPFCNNWFSTHPAMAGLRDAYGMMEEDVPPTVVLYPMMAANRRRERRPELVRHILGRLYTRRIDMTHHEEVGRFLESTGSLCMHDQERTVYAALSPRTDPDLARAWADKMGYRLIPFRALDEGAVPYYHTNVMMYVGHGLAAVCLESIESPAERRQVEESLEAQDVTVIPLTRAQVNHFAANALSLTNGQGERLLVMSTQGWHAYTDEQKSVVDEHCRVLHTDLTVFEDVGGGSARCLIGELF